MKISFTGEHEQRFNAFLHAFFGSKFVSNCPDGGPSVEEHLTTFPAPGYVGNIQRKRNPSMNGSI